jgi:hypothetical protein
MGLILAIDPGPTTCGVVLYDAIDREIAAAPAFLDGSAAALSVEDTLSVIHGIRGCGPSPLVAIERVQSAGISGASLLQTSEVVGRLQQRALDCGLRVRLVYRREVCSALHVSGGAKDAQVRQRMIEMHPGGVGTKKAPGPLYGVSSHAWQALGLAVAVTLLPEEP